MSTSVKTNLYYKRDLMKDVVKHMKGKSIDIGDSFDFQGNLFKDKDNKYMIASTKIVYKILHKINNGFVIGIKLNAKFNNDCSMGTGTLVFEGRIYSPDFNVISGKVVTNYHTEIGYLSLIKSNKDFEGAYGITKYSIVGTSGILNMNIEIPNK
jgi:hypothetical protein